MVSFTCMNCGDTLKENIDQHVGECRGPFPLTCIDCKEDFYDNLYVSHTRCILEERKRAQPRTPNVPATVVPLGAWQEPSLSDWMSCVHAASESPDLTPRQSELLAALAKCANVPQVLPTFQKFARTKWTTADSDEDTIPAVFRLLETQVKTIGARRTAVWLTAVDAARDAADLTPPQGRLLEALSRRQNRGKVPYNHRSEQFQKYVSKVWPESVENADVVSEVFGLIQRALAAAWQPQKEAAAANKQVCALAESSAAERSKKKKKSQEQVDAELRGDGEVTGDAVENGAGKKKKKKQRKHEEAVEEEETSAGSGEIACRKSKKDKHKRRSLVESVEEEVAPRKKLLRSA